MLGSTTYQALQPNINVSPSLLAPNWQVLPAPAGAGVSSLSTLTGAITQSCSAGTYTTAGNDIALTIAFPVAPVDSVNGITGAPVVSSGQNPSLEVVNASPDIVVGLNPNAFGTYTELAGGVSSATITSAVCITTSVILLTYIHSGGGGGTQYITNITPSAGTFQVDFNANIDINDKINWFVMNPADAVPP
jgi:hypothetical protein